MYICNTSGLLEKTEMTINSVPVHTHFSSEAFYFIQ